MNGKIKKMLSAVSITLCATIGLSLPVEVYASTLPEKENNYSSFNNVVGENPEESKIVKELTGERTENSKEFLLEDGTKMVAEYDQPVHYQNDKGKWVDYDNSLVAENTVATADEASDNDYVNKNSNIEVKLSNKAKKNNMVKVTSDNYSISWGYENANKSKAKIVTDDTKLSGNDKFTTLKNLTSETLYEDVFKNVDLQYFVSSTGVKENIILKSSDVQNEFNLTYKIKNLSAKQIDNYTISLSNKNGEEVYTISAPYMYDAKGETSTQLKLSIESQKGSNLNVKLTTDYWFIHSIGRSFPITIDPELTYKLNSKISFQQINNNIALSYGPYYLSNNGYVYTNINYIPKLNVGEKIINAKINFETTNGESVLTKSTDKPIVIKAHSTESKSKSGNLYCDDVLDYDALTYDNSTYFSFDITKEMKNACDSNASKISIAFEALDTIGSNTLIIQSGSKKSETPSLTYTYKDFTGTEGSLSYHTVSVGQNAQASICDYLGNLVIRQTLYEGTGSRMPLNITATYNSINKDTAFENGSASGYGWQFSFNQYVREVTDKNLTKAGYNYIYTDADGTDHYLKLTEGETAKWEDEDSLGITLTKDENNIFIDNGSTTQTYESTANGGKLLSEKDEHKNTITYTYTDGDLTKITDGSGREVQLKYKSSTDGKKVVSRITKPDDTKIDIGYSTGRDKVSSISFNNGHISQFEYDSNYNLVSVSSVSDNYMKSLPTHKFTYTNGKVTDITEYGTDGTEGNHLNISYNTDNTTVFTDKQGHSETHIFDNSGSTVSVLNSNGYATSSKNTGLVINNSANAYTKNYITESSQQTEVGGGKYYFVSNGAKGSTTSTGGKVTVDSSAATEEDGYYQYLGTTSLKVENPVSKSNSAFFTGAAHQFNTTELNGKTVTFSSYVKTKDITEIYSGGSVGAILKVKCLDSSGKTVKEINSIGLTGTLDWQRISVTANIPDTTSCFRVYCLIRYASGTAWFDCLQLEEGNCANDFNALQNADFESNDYWLTNENKAISAEDGTVTLNGEAGAYDNAETVEDSTAPTEEETQPATYYETVTETVPNDSITTYDDYGNVIKTEQGFVTRTVKNAYEVKATDSENSTTTDDSEESVDNSTNEDTVTSGDSFGNKYIYQNVQVGKAGVMFNIVGEAQAKSVPLTNENRTFGIALNIYYEGSTTPETHYQEFNSATSHKQTVSMAVTPEKTSEKIKYVAFAFVYGNNSNTMTAHSAMLNISSAYVTDSTDEETKTETDDNLIDSEIISESIDTTQEHMVTSSEYDSTNNYAVSETDEAGNTVTYTYDTNGNATSVTDGNGNVVNYTYNTNNDITSISSNGAETLYSYNNSSNISAITHNGFSYTFNYDVFNNLISTNIGDVALVSNTYSSNNGNLTKSTYANGDYIEYTYDKYNNITKLTSETGVIAEFVYNKKGLVAKAVDKSASTTTYYYYDFSGTLTGEYRQTDGGNLSYFLSYDGNGNKVEKNSINGQTKTITTGTDENGKSYVSNDGVTAKTSTDDFGRKTEVKTSRGEGNSVFFTDYEYASGKSENSTTNLVSKLTQKYGSDELVNYEYTYDNNGNITEIYENGTLAYKYTYDSLNQLYQEYDYVNLFYISYSYDGKGNILAKHEQALHPTYLYPTGKDSGNVYYYSDTEWTDKLTKINQYNITYDESGNPLSYRDGMTMTWQNGRQLASLQTEDNEVNYKYDSNGMRTQKTDNSGTTYYYYDSDKNLIGLTKGNNTLLFYYDSDGNVTSLKYNGTMLYYVKNLQGDVVKIISHDGVGYVSYVYDAWGNVKSVSGEPILRELNPFRYRSYVYDTESGLYYLQSRYYDPFTGRFINADIYCDTQSGTPLSTNMFAYCENNAIMFTDYNGKMLKEEKNAGRKFWKNWVIPVLKRKNWTYSAKFLEHSLCDSPSNLWYNSSTQLSKKILKTKEFKKLVDNVRNKHKNKWITNYKCSLTYNSGDLLGAFHAINVTVNEMWINGQRTFQFLLYDKYDFKLENYTKNWAIMCGNNMAVVDQNQGIIVPYKIYVIVYAKR